MYDLSKICNVIKNPKMITRYYVSYRFCQVHPDHSTMKHNSFNKYRLLSQLSFVSLLSGST